MASSTQMSDVTRKKKSGSAVHLRAASPTNPNGATGPITPEGKVTASGNAITHGCTAKPRLCNGKLTPEAEARMILPDERMEDWAELLQSWHDEYHPETELAVDLVVKAAVADWMMNRTRRRYDQAEHRLYLDQPDATLWSVDQHALLEKFLRYQARAERSFARARNIVEQTRREKKKDAEKAAGSLRPAPPRSRPTPTHHDADFTEEFDDGIEAAPPRPGSLIQCITVQVLDGRTFSLFQPKSDNLKQIILSADEPKPIVKRALYFLDGIPEEYNWITEYDSHDGRPHFVIERSSQEALHDLEREREDGSGHLLPI